MNGLLQVSKRFLDKNASTILTCLGGVGVVATAVITAKAAQKALSLIEKAEKEKGEELTKIEKVKVATPVYIPAVITGAATVACIFGANSLNKRSQAALMSAYALLDSSYKDYKKKITEIYGVDADSKIRNEIAKEKYEEIEVDDGKKLFYDYFSNRYFESTMEKVLYAEYNINRSLSMNGYAALNEFYEFLDIPAMEYGSEIGWSQAELFETSWQNWLDFHHDIVEMDDGLECCIISMMHEPSLSYKDY